MYNFRVFFFPQFRWTYAVNCLSLTHKGACVYFVNFNRNLIRTSDRNVFLIGFRYADVPRRKVQINAICRWCSTDKFVMKLTLCSCAAMWDVINLIFQTSIQFILGWILFWIVMDTICFAYKLNFITDIKKYNKSIRTENIKIHNKKNKVPLLK